MRDKAIIEERNKAIAEAVEHCYPEWPGVNVIQIAEHLLHHAAFRDVRYLTLEGYVRRFLAAKVAAGEFIRFRFTQYAHYGEGQATLYCKPEDRYQMR